jgi:hypothetical protein
MKNRLENWIKARSADQIETMNLLQEYGVISDNCVNVQDVGNDTEAMKWMACNYKLIKNGTCKPLD